MNALKGLAVVGSLTLIISSGGGCSSDSGAGGTGGTGGSGATTAGTGGRQAGTGGGAATSGSGGSGPPSTGGHGTMAGSGGAPGTGGGNVAGGATGASPGASGGGASGGNIGPATGGKVGGGSSGGSSSTGGAGGTSTSSFICPPGPFPAPMLTGLNPTRVVGVPMPDAFNNNQNNFSVIEGPVWTGDGLYVTEIGTLTSPPPARILRMTAAGVVSIALSDAGVNGLALDRNGNLVGANHKDGAITRFTLPGLTPMPIVSMFGGMRFNSPNDLTFRADGNLYFSDADFQAPAVRPQPKNRLYRVAPGASAATVIDENRTEPNGVTLSPDGNTLYVSCSDGIYRYPLAADGSAGAGTKIAPSIGASDGMAVDCGGYLYIANSNANSLNVVDPSGNLMGTITVAGVQATTNAAFGGADHKTLYITVIGSGTLSGLFKVEMNVPGFPY